MTDVLPVTPTPASSTPATPAPSCACVAALSSNDERRLATLEPTFAAKVRTLLRLMAIAGHRMFITADGARRTTAEQQALYAKGRTAPGDIVTSADGVQRRSKHQDGVACDCAFVDTGEGVWAGPWDMYGSFAEGLGLVWGGRWKRPDRPHCEMR